MHYGEIKKCDIANGPGVRVSLFVSGCRNHCPGCFNKETWDFCYGKPTFAVWEVPCPMNTNAVPSSAAASMLSYPASFTASSVIA